MGRYFQIVMSSQCLSEYNASSVKDRIKGRNVPCISKVNILNLVAVNESPLLIIYYRIAKLSNYYLVVEISQTST